MEEGPPHAVDSVEESLLHVVVGDEDDRENVNCSWPVFTDEMKKQFHIALPMIGVNMVQSSLQLVSIMIVGHLSELSLSGISVASSFCTVTGFSLMIGLASGLETLCGQAYGAKQYRLQGILLQRAVFTLLCTAIPLSLLWMYIKQILLAFGQDPLISAEAGMYANWLIPSLFAYAFLQPLVKFLQTQSIVMPLMLCSAFTLAVHAPLCWFLVFKVGLGIKGAALSLDISFWLNVILVFVYVKFSPACRNTQAPISNEALHDISKFLNVAMPSALMYCLEWWSFELLVVLSGLLPNPELATSVLSICLNTSAFSYMIPLGISAASSTRVSNELGAGNTAGALLAVRVTLCISVTETLVRGIALLSVKNIWGHAFSNELEVIHYLTTIMPLLSLTSVVNGIHGALTGIVRGCGQQRWGAFANIGAYYLVGLPLAAILAFVLHLDALGLWWGIFGGLLAQTIALFLITMCNDWKKLTQNAQELVCDSALPLAGSGMAKDSHTSRMVA